MFAQGLPTNVVENLGTQKWDETTAVLTDTKDAELCRVFWPVPILVG
jgi:hypothetical protein